MWAYIQHKSISVPSDPRVPSVPSDPRVFSVPSDLRVPSVPSDPRVPSVPSDPREPAYFRSTRNVIATSSACGYKIAFIDWMRNVKNFSVLLQRPGIVGCITGIL